MTGRWLLTLEDSRLLRVGRQAELGHQAPGGAEQAGGCEGLGPAWFKLTRKKPGQPCLFFKHRQLGRAGRCTLGCAGRVF